MKKQDIFGYYDYYFDSYSFSKKGEGKGETIIDKNPSNVRGFFQNDHICPFCKTSTKIVFLAFHHVTIGVDLYESAQVLECEKCGWWTYKTRFSEELDYIDKIDALYCDNKYYAITKKYDISDKIIPIEVLGNELKKKNELVYSMDPYKLEELCTEILKGVYDCEVHHVGMSGDGGKDIIILESDDPILVQVKRRENPDHVELVKGVREFVGTMFIEDVKKGIYISTAKRFSRGAEETKEQLIDNRKLDYFEFVNYDKLRSMIGEMEPKKNWSNLVEPFYKKIGTQVYDTDESLEKYRIENYDILHYVK